MQTLWNKGTSATQIVEDFTVGNDRELDLKLARYDVLGSKAHIAMLAQVGLLKKDEEQILQKELDNILGQIEGGSFVMEDEAEDIHSQIEILLTRKLGAIGKKIHSGRSRNDQVLVDLKLYMRDELDSLAEEVKTLFAQYQELSERHKEVLLPGYTHAQVAMPSSFGLWFGAYAETLADDMVMIRAARRIVDQNPLGSAAGYGSSFPLDRKMTTRLLNFGDLHYNSIAAQMSRSKAEKAVAAALAAVSSTLNKFAADCCMYMCTNFKFISFPDSLTTGSSIMPHKKNPDVWEMVRAKTNRLQSVQNEIALLTTNQPHGYHRDYQLLKDILFPAFELMHSCLRMTSYMLEHISVNEHILEQDSKYDPMFTVEVVNNKVVSGVPFRDAYREVGIAVQEGRFTFDKPAAASELAHTHEGSMGNLCTKEIKEKMDKAAKG
ncbi:MAG: argininosuccinate lyase [Bacteroidales bacterium]|nr:argininosuccinate lyase [Bacteroidales bacterium]MBO7479354.1 argininosuccinate lyase [Bacteroidales bacterium]MBO7488156.1 argininosuccinate lyase [Bacteroidales bacterium]